MVSFGGSASTFTHAERKLIRALDVWGEGSGVISDLDF